MKQRYNQEIRNKIKMSNIAICELSYHIGIAETTLFRWLRRPLDPEHEKIIMDALKRNEVNA
jgi:lambda repressor-like predicted transcriptional regulator